MVDIIGLLNTDGYIMANKTIIRKFGADCAILIGELCAEYKFFEAKNELSEDGSFYSTQDNIEYNTGLNSYAQRNAVRTLTDAGILVVNKRGLPAKNYYKIVVEKLSSLFFTSASNFEQLDTENPHLNNNRINNNKEDNSNSINRITPDEDYSSHGYSDDDLKEEFLQSKKRKGNHKNLFSKCFDEIIAFTGDIGLRDDLVEYLQMRINIKDKPIVGVNQWKGLLNKLEKLDGDKRKIVQQSIEKGWLSFYPLSDSRPRGYSEAGNLSCEQDTRTEEERIAEAKRLGMREKF